MNPITVLLAEDHLIVRKGILALLQPHADIHVLGEAATGREAVELAMELRPDVVVMDISMPQLNGLEATRQIRASVPNSKVLILSAHRDDAYIEQVKEVGAAGYLVKQASPRDLVKAIKEIHKGNTFPCASNKPRPDGRCTKLPRQTGMPMRPTTRLTPREREVLQLIAEGSGNKQAAAELGVSVKTVEKHRQNLMGKLDIHDTAGLTRYAISTGVVESNAK